MKRIILFAAVAALTFGIQAKTSKKLKSANDTTVTFVITPVMHCNNCVAKIKNNLRFEKGVSAIEASAPDSVVTIRFDKRKTDTSRLSKAFSKIGYTATSR